MMTNESLPELTLYCAVVNTDKGKPIYTKYIYETSQEAAQSGYEYNVATWEDINDFADVGVYFGDAAVCTPQGVFVWTEIYELNEFGIGELVHCTYRHLGAPERFSEAIEYYLLCNIGSELVSIVREEEGYLATISNREGKAIIIRSQ